MDYKDAGHRPHARHTGEVPRNKVTHGPESIKVTLDAWGPERNLMSTMYNALQANWGEQPSRVINDDAMTPGQLDYVDAAFAGRTLPQILELPTFSFTVDGVTRACTHQLVRSRIGASMMQHGGRDNDWRHRPWTMPETIRRASLVTGLDWNYAAGLPDDQEHCVTDPEPIREFLNSQERVTWNKKQFATLGLAIRAHLKQTRALYAAMVDAGIPWQDARRILPIGMQTYIHIDYTYLALKGVLANRLEHVMDWEINCVSQLILREVKMHCPPIMSKYLGSRSDGAGKAVFGGMESWPPDGKYVVEDRHLDLPREHTPQQNPFWVLHPDSMAGGPVVWVETNGTYPWDRLG
jgi:thymidylate synthase ThyX